MTIKKAQSMARLFSALAAMGFSLTESGALVKIERTLHRWAEGECGDGNGCISRDDTTGKPFREYEYGGAKSYPIADREAGALRRLAGIMAGKAGLLAYHQGDCRGCSLYIVKAEDLHGQSIASVYSRGLAVSF